MTTNAANLPNTSLPNADPVIQTHGLISLVGSDKKNQREEAAECRNEEKSANVEGEKVDAHRVQEPAKS